jgi:hypothetical protein
MVLQKAISMHIDINCDSVMIRNIRKNERTGGRTLACELPTDVLDKVQEWALVNKATHFPLFTEWLRFWTSTSKAASVPASKEPSAENAPLLELTKVAPAASSSSQKTKPTEVQPLASAHAKTKPAEDLPVASAHAAATVVPVIKEPSAPNTPTKPLASFFSEQKRLALQSLTEPSDFEDTILELSDFKEKGNVPNNALNSIARNRPKRGCSIKSQKCISDYFSKK